jgi:hypothetical protein
MTAILRHWHQQDSRLHLRPRHGLCHCLSSRLPSFPRTSTRGIYSQGTHCNAIPPDNFWTELRDSLTDFYKNILKKAGSWRGPVAKPLSRKFVTKAAPVPPPDPSADAAGN